MTSGRSIGEVIATLKVEFPDVTISKIRFLESQGLVTPERKPSGYRIFSAADLARLQYILREQKQHFLPLKVIKERLESLPAPAVATADDGSADSQGSDASGKMITEAELGERCGLSLSQIRELEKAGFLKGEPAGNQTFYDHRGVVMAKLAARFFSLGVEVRHLRLYKTAADREADLYQQLTVAPRDQRNTTARMEYDARIEELTSLGAQLRSELLRSALES